MAMRVTTRRLHLRHDEDVAVGSVSLARTSTSIGRSARRRGRGRSAACSSRLVDLVSCDLGVRVVRVDLGDDLAAAGRCRRWGRR
jgi:hypothetical protein